MIYSVKIIHDELSGRGYRLLADFLRLVGIHVHDCTSKTEKKAEGYDVIFLITDEVKEDTEILKGFYPNIMVHQDILPDANMDSRKNFLHECISQMMDVVDKVDSEWKKLQDELVIIADIFVDNRLMYHRNAYVFSSSCYGSQATEEEVAKSNDIIKAAQVAYAKAMIAFRESCGKKLTPYGYYAQMSLARSINETCNLLNQKVIFDTKLCLNVLDSILKIDHNFKNVYVLQAFYAEMDDLYVYEAEAYYKTALNLSDGKAYLSYPAYRLGRYYEKKLQENDNASSYYKRSLELNSHEYRAIYKNMLALKEEMKYTEAVKLCEEICNILSRKEATNYLQPREYEYLVKAYSEQVRMQEENIGDAEKRGEAAEKLNRLYSRMMQTNEMYQWIFEDKASEFAQQTYNWLKNSLV